jgi:hypothetical protein
MKIDVSCGIVGKHLYLVIDDRFDGLLCWIIFTFRDHPDREIEAFGR